MAATYTKPTKIPRWADSGSVTEPAEGKKDLGWVYEEVPPSSYENWKAKLIGEWFKWLDERIFDGTTEDDLLIKSPGDGSDALLITDTYLKTHKELRIDGSDLFEFAMSGSDPVILFKGSAGNTYIKHVAATDDLEFYVAGTANFMFNEAAAYLAGIDFTNSTGMNLNGLEITNCDKFKFDTNDFFSFVSNTSISVTLAGFEEMKIVSSGVHIGNGLIVGMLTGSIWDDDIVVVGGGTFGFTGTDPGAGEVYVGDANFKVDLNGTTPEIHFDVANGDLLLYSRTSNFWQFQIGSTPYLDVRAASTTPGNNNETVDLGSSSYGWKDFYSKYAHLRGIILTEEDDEVYWCPEPGSGNDRSNKPIVVWAKNANASTAFAQYDLVALDDQTADQIHCEHSTTAGDTTVFGVAMEAISAGSWGKVAIWGPTKVNVVSATYAAGDQIGASTTAGSGQAVTAAGDYSIGQLTQGGTGTGPFQIWLTGAHGTG